MNKSKSDIIIDILSLIIIFEIRYLCKLEYQLGRASASKSSLPTGNSVENIQDRARQIVAVLQNPDEIL